MHILRYFSGYDFNMNYCFEHDIYLSVNIKIYAKLNYIEKISKISFLIMRKH